MVSNRRHDIDALRVFGTFAVFLFHTLQPFNSSEVWHVRYEETFPTARVVIWYLNFWIMPLFMLLAGSATWYSLKKRSSTQYLKERFVRIGLPLLFGIFIFVSPQVYLERLNQNVTSDSFFVFFMNDFFSGTYPSGNFSWHHLWFLVYLLTYSIVGLPLLLLIKKYGDKFLGKIGEYSHSGWLLLAWYLPIIGANYYLAPIFPKTNALINDWAWHSTLFISFVFGFILVTKKDFEIGLKKVAHYALAIGVTGIAFFYMTKGSSLLSGFQYRVVKGLVSGSWIVAFLGLARIYLHNPSGLFSRLNEISYPFYIVHQFSIVLMASWLREVEISPGSKWAVLFFSSLVLTMAIVEVARLTRFTRLIIGLPAPRRA